MSIPRFPSAYGDDAAREFTKDGDTYRMVRRDHEWVLITRVGTSSDQYGFGITDITHEGSLFDVHKWGAGGWAAFGKDREFLWDHL